MRGEARTLIKRLELPYEALRTIYEGDCEVYLYRNEITGAEQVGKRICTLGLDATVAFREATLLQSIRHPNLVPVIDVARRLDDPAYPPPMRVVELIMPYFPRGSVYDAFNRGERFSVVEACLHTQAGLLGLGELHERHGILHRDLKSPNVFLSDDASLLKVGDLGIAVPMDVDGYAEAHSNPQLYSAPEIFTKRVDRRSDVYAMGLLLFEMVSGWIDARSYTIAEMEHRLAKGRPAPRPADLVFAPQVPPRLRRVITKAMSRDPTHRYPSARAMADAIAGAPVIDWQPVHVEVASQTWEGAAAHARDRRFRVEAVRRKDGRWTFSGLKHVSRWQRFVEDQVIAAPTGREATAFFDQVVKVALSR
jgi:hypothetical protein